MKAKDQLLRFSFDQLDIRGELVYLDESWLQILSRHDYPPNVRKQLGEALAIVSLLGVTIKFDGTLIMQIQGSGPLRRLVTQITSQGAVRGLARWDGEVPDGSLEEVFGKGNIIITVNKNGGERYQSIVELSGRSLAEALHQYFQQSEQLPTSFRLFYTEQSIAGFFLQALPPKLENAKNNDDRDEEWRRVNILADTIQQEEILSLDAPRLLHNLFHEEQVRLFDPVPVHFECTCSEEKVRSTLLSFGKEELNNILEEEGSIKVDCEFCNQKFSFDATDVESITNEESPLPPGTTLH